MRERLIGAIVLAIIAAVMVPWLMTHSHHPRARALAPAATAGAPAVLALQRPSDTPASPQMPSRDIAEATPSASAAGRTQTAPSATRRQSVAGDVTVAGGSQRTSIGTPAEPKSPPPAASALRRPAPAAAGVVVKQEPALGQGMLKQGDWYVQVASFSSQTSAAQLAVLLTRAGYHAFLSSHAVAGDTLYRVRVGPYSGRAKAEAVAPGLSAISGSRTIVRQASGSGG